MPTAKKNAYDKLKKSELKALLLERDQSTTGLQSTLTALITNSDNEHRASQDDVLDFLGFPGEVRNKIYKLVADYIVQRDDSRVRALVCSDKDWDWKKDRRLAYSDNPHLTIIQPGLFITCRQTRIEGLPFFYKGREFYLPLSYGKPILDLSWKQTGFSRWFHAISDIGQQNIRHLTLRNTGKLRAIDSIERIHRRLSDEATVVYEAHFPSFARTLWKIGARYKAKNMEKIPSFWRNWYSNNLNLSNFDRMPEFESCDVFRLGFKAGCGWFGMAQNDRAQLWWKRDQCIENWIRACGDEASWGALIEARDSGPKRRRRAQTARVAARGNSVGDTEVEA